MLSGRAAAKILICYDNIAFFYIFHKVFVDVFHAVPGKLISIRDV